MIESPYTRRRAPPMEPASQAIYAHSRTRTTSSNTIPMPMPMPVASPPNSYHPQGGYAPQAGYQPQDDYQPQMHLVQPQMSHQRRTPSVNTFSTVSSGGMPQPNPYRTSPSMDIRRSTSSRSGGGTPGSPQPTSYVALLRKQKATVWCDRAQYEDPRILAQQRAAKARASAEMVNAATGLGLPTALAGRTSTGLSSTGGKVAAKIRHHGKPTVVGYSPGSNYTGVGGVPLRLSATEVEGEESDDDETMVHRHRRTGSSSRSSTASGRKASGYRSSGGLGGSNSLSGGRRWSPNDTPERTGSLVEERLEEKEDEQQLPDEDETGGKARSFASGSSGERLDAVADLDAKPSRLANNSRHAALQRELSAQSTDDLKRRGSVDERTMTMSTGRLFIANPD